MLTTAQLVGQFVRELREQGLDDEATSTLATAAFNHLMRSGNELRVRLEEAGLDQGAS